MALLFFLGKFTLVAFMATLMGVPFAYYLRKDMEWQRKGCQLDKWYDQ